jgi:hypothetical protein
MPSVSSTRPNRSCCVTCPCRMIQNTSSLWLYRCYTATAIPTPSGCSGQGHTAPKPDPLFVLPQLKHYDLSLRNCLSSSLQRETARREERKTAVYTEINEDAGVPAEPARWGMLGAPQQHSRSLCKGLLRQFPRNRTNSLTTAKPSWFFCLYPINTGIIITRRAHSDSMARKGLEEDSA